MFLRRVSFMIKPKISLLILLLILAYASAGQNYIGMHKSEICRIVTSENEGFEFDNEVLNKKRSFIKFVNQHEEQTLLFMLNDDGICTSVSRMYNTWMYDRIRKDLKKRYTFCGFNKWIETKNGHEYEIILKKGEWFLTVTTRKKQ